MRQRRAVQQTCVMMHGVVGEVVPLAAVVLVLCGLWVALQRVVHQNLPEFVCVVREQLRSTPGGDTVEGERLHAQGILRQRREGYQNGAHECARTEDGHVLLNEA